MFETNPFVFVLGVFVLMMVARSIVVIREGWRGGLVRLGRYLRTLQPGLHFRVPFIDLVTQVDLDAHVPGWQGMTDRQLDAAIASLAGLPSEASSNDTKFKAPALEAPTRSKDSAAGDSPRDPATESLAAWLLRQASDQTGVDLSKDSIARARIAESAARALAEVRSAGESEINLPFLTATSSGPKHFTMTLTRSQLDEALRSARR